MDQSLFHAVVKGLNRRSLALGALFIVEFGVLTWLTRMEPLRVPPLLIGFGTAFVSYTLAVLILRRHPGPLWIWFLAGVVLRLPWLATGLTLSDDAWRYLHDGRAQIAGVNPYRHPPAAPETISYRGPEFTLINHPHLPTIYPPVAQLAFRGAVHLGGTLLSWKLLLVLFDLGIGLAAARVLRARNLPPGRAAIYFLHPLPVIEFAGNAHVDAIAIIALVSAVALAERRRIASGAALALSIATKYLPLPLLPFFGRHLGGRHQLAFWLGATGVFVIVYASFLDYPPIGSLGVFGETFEFNGSLYIGLRTVGLSATLARAVLAMGLVALLVWLWRTSASAEDAAFAWTAGVLLASPIVHPWYVLWIVPFLVWRQEWWPFVWSGTVVASYAVLTAWRAEGVWMLPLWAWSVEYVPVFVLLAVPLVRRAAPRRNSNPSHRNPRR